MKTALFTVTNDLFADQRVNKMARTLHELGFRVILAGVKRRNSQPFSPSYARVKRIRIVWQKGFLFYAGYNIQLFFFLLFARFDILVANDLDTLLPAHLVARLRRKQLVYDTHEYFTGTPEVFTRPLVLKVWKWLENRLFPQQSTIITVNQSIAKLYHDEYGKELHVVRNVPFYREPIPREKKNEAGLRTSIFSQDFDNQNTEHIKQPIETDSEHFIILQGTGINVDRGAEELVEAMLPDHGIRNATLLIIGGGNAIGVIRKKVAELGLQDRVRFLPKMAYEELYRYTAAATIGVSIDKDHGLNYRFSLPNKLFDYIMAGTPVLVSDLPEVSRIVDRYQVGKKIMNHDPAHIAGCINEMIMDEKQWQVWHQNCLRAARELCWENEAKTVKKLYTGFL